MTVTQRGQLADDDVAHLLAARDDQKRADADYRRVVVEMVAKSSIRVVATHTGLSTNTVQRWNDEAKTQ